MKTNIAKYFTIIIAIIFALSINVTPSIAFAKTHHHHKVYRHRIVKKPIATTQSILNELKANYPRYLNAATVQYGTANGYQAICYYTASRIVVNPKHTDTLARILNHEVWHIIDWKDNGRIDWGENIPPANAASYKN
jgi:hypothetical protein